MTWNIPIESFHNELQKIASEKKAPLSEKVIDVGAPMLVGSGVGKTLSDLSLSNRQGASPRRKTIGTLVGALGGLGWYKANKQKQERKKSNKALAKEVAKALTKTSEPFVFKGTATQRFLGKPGKSISDISPKIGRIGTLPKI